MKYCLRITCDLELQKYLQPKTLALAK